MKQSYPRGVLLSHLRKFECRPLINVLVTKHRTSQTTPTSPLVENYPSCSHAGHRQEEHHPPATSLLSSCSALASHWLSLLFPLVTAGFPHKFIQMSSSIKLNKATGKNAGISINFSSLHFGGTGFKITRCPQLNNIT